MTWQEILMWAVVGLIGFPAAVRFFPLAVRNVTALALVSAWLAAEVIVYRTGNSLPFRLYFVADVTVIFVIYAKTIKRCGAKIYSSMREQLRCMVTDLTLWDRFIVAIFLLGAWPLYILAIDQYWKWMALWALTIAQFLLAGWEAFAGFREARRKAEPTPIIDRHLKIIPFPVRVADAVKKPPVHAGVLLIAKGSGGYG